MDFFKLEIPYFQQVQADIALFNLRYETPTTLLLRKVLRRENPLHSAILDSFPETQQQRQESPGPQPFSAMGSVVTQPRVKRERGVPSEVIDLAGPSRVTQAEPLAPGEQLVCDLTEEEDAPKWAKRRAR